MPRLAALLFPFALVFLFSVHPLAQASDEVAVLLAKPVSPGTLALLVPHGADPRVQERWVAALKSESVDARLTAARMLAVAGKPDAVPALRTALEAEADAGPALEMTRALLRVDREADALVLAAAARLEASSLLMELGRARGPQALRHLAHVRQHAPEGLTRYIEAMLVADPALVDRLAQSALDAPDDRLWRAIIELRQHGQLVADSTLEAALVRGTPQVRALTWWYITSMAILADPPSPASWWVERARQDDPELDALPAEMAFGRELAARVAGKPAVTARSFVERLDDGDVRLPGDATMVLDALERFLTDEEWRALALYRFGDASMKRPPPGPSSGAPRAVRTARPSAPMMVRTVDDLPPALVADVLKVTRCKGDSRGRMSAAVVAYAGDGRPVRLDWVKSSLRDECDRAARALLLTSLVGGARRTGEAKDLVVLPVSERFLDCLATTGPAEKPYRVGWDPRLRERIEPPKKVADLRPHYPPALQESRTQGIVILDAAITTTGCVRQLRVLKSVDPGLDIESAYAVANWAFTPTRLDGKPVPVSMTVTVQFSLR